MKVNEAKENYDDQLALNIRILQVIEKYDLKAQIGSVGDFVLQGETNNFYNISDIDKDFIIAIKLPTTKSEIKTGDNFEGSALKEFLDIKNIFNDPLTEVVNLEQRGEEFKAERYHLVKNLETWNFNLVDNEIADSPTAYRRQSGNFFVFADGVEVEQIVLYIRFTPIFMMFNNSYWNFHQLDENGSGNRVFQKPVLLTDSHYDIPDFSQCGNTMNITTRIYLLYGLYSIYLLSQQHDLGLNGSFIDKISARVNATNHQSNNSKLDLSNVRCTVDQNLSDTRLDVIMMNPIPEQFSSIDSPSNTINPLDTHTYARFLFTGGDQPKAVTAFEILPETAQVANIIKIKQFVPSDNAIRIIRTELFLPETGTSKHILEEVYHQWVADNIEDFHQKWAKIVDRANRYQPIGFVAKMSLALLFIQKYIWPYFAYSHNVGVQKTSHAPQLFSFLEENWGLDIGAFFGISGFESYFDGFHKVKADVTSVDSNSLRYDSIGALQGTHYYRGVHERMYFPKEKFLEAIPKHTVNFRHQYEPTYNLIINDSYTKQAWKPKVKAFMKQLKEKPGIQQFYILTTNNKLETMLLVKVLRDRKDVYQFSKFESGLAKPKRTKKTKEVKMMMLDQQNANEINKRKNWGYSGAVEDTDTDDKLFIPYSVREGIFFDGRYQDPYLNHQRFRVWEKIVKQHFNKTIWFISEKDIRALREGPEVMTLDNFFQTEEFKEKIPQIANDKILLDHTEVEIVKETIGHMQTYFLSQIYSTNRITPAIAEHIYFQFLDLIPNKDLQNLLFKVTTYFPEKRTLSYYSEYNFINFIAIPPTREYFDYDIFQEINRESDTVFSEDEIKAAKDFNTAYRRKFNRYNVEKDSLKFLLEDTTVLLSKSNYLNLDKEDEEMIISSRLNLYLVDLLTLLNLTIKENHG